MRQRSLATVCCLSLLLVSNGLAHADTIIGVTSDADVTFIAAGMNAPIGTFAIDIVTAGERANMTAGTNQTSALGQDEVLTINGVNVTLTAGMQQAAVVNRINEFTLNTGVTADILGGATRLYTESFGSAAVAQVVSNIGAAANSTGFGTTVISDSGVDINGTIGGAAGVGIGDRLIALDIELMFASDVTTVVDTVSGSQGTVTTMSIPEPGISYAALVFAMLMTGNRRTKRWARSGV